MKRPTMKIIVILIMSIYSCSSINNQNTTEYYKRDNMVYSDPFIYESVIKLHQDSFVFAQYKEPFNAFVYKGIVETENQIRNLVVTESKAISLNTGQPIKTKDDESKLEFELTKSKNSTIQIRKYQNGDLVSSFRYRPYKPINKLNKLEEWFFNETTSSMKAFWSIKSHNKPIPPKPEISESEKLLRIEVDRLREQRQIKLDDFVNNIVTNCSIEVRDSIILNLTVKPDGKIENFKIAKANKMSKIKVNCVDEFIGQTKVNLGILKVVPSASTGTIAQKHSISSFVGDAGYHYPLCSIIMKI